LSYTEFLYARPQTGAAKLSAKKLNEALRHLDPVAKGAVTVSADVTNSGSVAAEEVAELYVRLTGTSVAEPVRSLKGFERISLAPGERKRVNFSLEASAFALWDVQNELMVEPCHVQIWVSPDSSRGESIDLDIGE
jgi:beta-glucosidase